MGAATARATRSARWRASDLGTSSPSDHVQAGDEHEGDGDRDGMGVENGVGNAADPVFEHVGQDRLAQPA